MKDNEKEINKLDIGKSNIKKGNTEMGNYQQKYIKDKLSKINWFKDLEGDKKIYNLYLNETEMNLLKNYSQETGVALGRVVSGVLKIFVKNLDFEGDENE